jgi:nucleotide-binding universal stress UspA family protein
MIRRVLCASDLSEAADEAVRQAASYCEEAGSLLVVLHVEPSLERRAWAEYGLAALLPEEMKGLEARAREALEAQLIRAGVRLPRLKAEVVTSGEPIYAEIVRRSEAEGIDLLVVSSRGASGLARVLLGSVAERVVRHAHCSVLVARPSPASGAILVANDFSPPSQAAVIAAKQEMARRGETARLTVAHCLDLPSDALGPGYWSFVSAGGAIANARAARKQNVEQRLQKEVREAGLEAAVTVEEGAPSSAIVRIAESMSAELVVLGSSGKTGLSRVLLGSVAESVIRRAPCSVLVVRARAPSRP